MTGMIKICPKCNAHRPESEMQCGFKDSQGITCGWSLLNENSLTIAQANQLENPEPPEAQPETINIRHCINGHELAEGDLVCFVCGAAEQTESSEATIAGERIEDWLVQEEIFEKTDNQNFYSVVNQNDEHGFLVLYCEDHEPDLSIYKTMEKLDYDHLPNLLSTGRWRNQPYEVHEWIEGGSLSEAGYFGFDNRSATKAIIHEITKALESFSEVGLRHRNLCPQNILIRTKEPLDLVITNFGSARLSDFDLDIASPLSLTKYSAPEAIVGAISAASDWWSLGMIVLEQLTNGECFAGVNDKAFMLHTVTTGVKIPDNIEPDLQRLLKGLLAKDPNYRWQNEQVFRWLNGEEVELPNGTEESNIETLSEPITLAETRYFSPERFALAAAEFENWEEGNDLFNKGELQTWLKEFDADSIKNDLISRIVANDEIDIEFKYPLALMALNKNLPLTYQGDLVTPSWLIKNPELGYQLVFSSVPDFLEHIDRETWLTQLKVRGEKVRDRAQTLDIQTDDILFKRLTLIASRATLDAEEYVLRQAYPDSDHAGLASLMHKKRLNEEDLLILLSCDRKQLTPLSVVLTAAEELAKKYNIETFDSDEARSNLTLPLDDLYKKVEERIANFARCGIERIDDWADTFRIERRLSLQRASIILCADEDLWVIPEKQQYKENIIRFFEKRVINSVLRGPLVRLTISKTSSRIDLTELDSPTRSAQSLINFLIERTGVEQTLDPFIFSSEQFLESRIRRMTNQAIAYRRETGIDSLYLGFPFLMMNSRSSNFAKPRIAPILLWPINLNIQNNSSRGCTLSFDKLREEIRLNPALEGLLGKKDYKKLLSLRDEALNRTSINTRGIMEIFSVFGNVENYNLTTHPNINKTIEKDSISIICSAVIFNAKFTGQAISEDLRQLKQLPIENTSLDTLLMIDENSTEESKPALQEPENDFSVVESDPSQNIAIKKASLNPGVVIEGPPGTGKSQTIVNVIADSIGRGESVLVVCQKQAALNVVRKRLEAENLGQRLCEIIDINRDRQPVIKQIREQIENIFLNLNSNQKLARVKAERFNSIEKIKTLDHEINSYSEALFKQIPNIDKSYRDIICELIKLESESENFINCSKLRRSISGLDHTSIFKVESTCKSLARDWFLSNYERSPYHGLKVFSYENSRVAGLNKKLNSVREQEIKREQLIHSLSSEFDVGEITSYEEWVGNNDEFLKNLSNEDYKNIAKWSDFLFQEKNGDIQLAKSFLEELRDINKKLGACCDSKHDSSLFQYALKLENKEAAKLIKYSNHILKKKTFFSKFNLFRTFRNWKVKEALIESEGKYLLNRVATFRDALHLELKIRPIRANLSRLYKNLKNDNSNFNDLDLITLKFKAKTLLNQYETGFRVSVAVNQCPRQNDAIKLFKASSNQKYQTFKEKLLDAVKRFNIRTESINNLKGLEEWFKVEWIEKLSKAINDNQKTSGFLTKLIEQQGTIEAFQSFRIKSSSVDQIILEIFSDLREGHSKLLNKDNISECVGMTIRREWLLAIKSEFEKKNPEVLSDYATINSKIKLLEKSNQNLKDNNKELLSLSVLSERMGQSSDWESITRLRGPRTKKLREFIDLGNDIDLMKIRPVWLMSPEVVSQVLPLKAGLFDVVIFDEASQILVDHSIPALFRAKRVVISGDEKQMPPNNSFSRKFETDENEIIQELDEDMSESEVLAIEEAWNRKEIKDCPDLLALGRATLPYTTLQIHYRSEFNALIEFSNYAFYAGKLSIPAKHPISEIKKTKPVELIKVNGLYDKQTNRDEANKVLEILKTIWLENDQPPPSIGVVTFNLKQAELIESVVQNETLINESFSKSYLAQSERKQDDEDMSFFIKNVENVQGDERDMIIFSTTFGYNLHGAFRRNFGSLGHLGGEKRLNVAITRARKKVIIVTSMPIHKISDLIGYGRKPNKPRDYIQAYLDYAEKKSNGEIELAKISAMRLTQQSKKTQNVNDDKNYFVNEVKLFIQSLGKKAVNIANDDVFSLDIAVENTKSGVFDIGIECDAPTHQLLSTATYREVWRPKVLSRSIKTIHRISCVDWYQNNAIEKEKLTKLISKIDLENSPKEEMT